MCTHNEMGNKWLKIEISENVPICGIYFERLWLCNDVKSDLPRSAEEYRRNGGNILDQYFC